MFKEMLSTKNEIEKHSIREIGSNVDRIDSSQLKFREILCPMSGQSLSSKQCATCPHKIEHHRAHKSGFLMVTTICRFSSQNQKINE